MTGHIRHFFPNRRISVARRAHFTFAVHPHLQALEQAAVLAAVALLARHLAVLVAAAAVHALVADAPLEEAFATLTGDDAIVQACGAIPTDKASTLVSWIICRGRGVGGRRGLRAIFNHFLTLNLSTALKKKRSSGRKNLPEGTRY